MNPNSNSSDGKRPPAESKMPAVLIGIFPDSSAISSAPFSDTQFLDNHRLGWHRLGYGEMTEELRVPCDHLEKLHCCAHQY